MEITVSDWMNLEI